MNISKKWLLISLATLLCSSLLAGCSEKKVPADKAVKDAYTQILEQSYNYSSDISADIKPVPTALIGTKGGLTADDAEQEHDLAELLKSPQSQSTITKLQSGKISINGAVDYEALKTEGIFSAHYMAEGFKTEIDIPFQLDLNDNITLYIDPKVASALQILPPNLKGKLFKLSLSDIPFLTDSKFKGGKTFVSKVNNIMISSIKNIDASQFKDVDLTAAAKQAGATRQIQVELTAAQVKANSNELMTQILDTFGNELNLTSEQIAETKSELISEGNIFDKFISGSMQNFGLNDKGQLVYFSTTELLRGAEHEGKINIVYRLEPFDKSAFKMDTNGPIATLADLDF